MTFASTSIVFLFQLYEKSGCYGSITLPLTYNGKIRICHLLPCYCRYFYITFSKMFPEYTWPFPIMHILFESLADFDLLSLQERCLIFYKPLLYNLISVVAMGHWFSIYLYLMSFVFVVVWVSVVGTCCQVFICFRVQRVRLQKKR